MVCVFTKSTVLLIFVTLKNCTQDVNKTLSGSPTMADLSSYLGTLRKIIEVCDKGKDKITIDMALGLFCISVNFKLILKYMTIPAKLKGELIDLLKVNTRMLTYFYDYAEQTPEQSRSTSHFTNDTKWVERIAQFRPLVLELNQEEKDILLEEYESLKSSLALYQMQLPSANASNHCLGSLKLTVNQTWPAPTCYMDSFCYGMLLNGTNTGYSLTHRLLWLLFARYGRGCALISQAADRFAAAKFCAMAFQEAHFLFSSGLLDNGYHIDLFLEQIGLCYLDGHTEFLQRTWLEEGMTYQGDDGCFTYYKPHSKQPAMRRFFNAEIRHNDGRCSHVTAVAALAYSSAVRHIAKTWIDGRDEVTNSTY